MLAGSAQTNIYLFSGSKTNITLNPGTYIITAYGAPGGGGMNTGAKGGLGAELSAEFNFSASTNLTLLVGGGGGEVENNGGGGGGGSFVVEGSTPLVIAGGGGGGGDHLYYDYGSNGNVSTNGQGGGGNVAHEKPSGGAGGTNGGGGTGGLCLFRYPGDYGPGPVSGAGGGGFLGNGGNGGDYGFTKTGGGGSSFETGGYGGSGGSYSGRGGYGGGGGGGIGSSGFEYGGGGGGGSIIDSSAITILTEVSGTNSPDDPPIQGQFYSGNGEIIITAAPVAIITGAAFGFTNGGFGFNVIGPSGSNVVIQASTDLQTWIPLQTNLLDSGLLYFSDAQSTTNVQRFYRAQLSP
jgi:hypothetical protein